MDNSHHILQFNGQSYSKNGLLELSQKKLDGKLAEWEIDVWTFIQEWFSADPNIQVTTSGSTGTPQQILLTKQNMRNSALATAEFFGLDAHQSALLCLPTRFIAGKMMIVRAFETGMDLVTMPSIGQPLRQLKQPVNFAAMTPFQVANILDDPSQAQRLASIDQVIIGGGEIPVRLRQRLERLPNKIYATYGMTETITHIAIQTISTTSPNAPYQVLPGVSVGVDQRGCLTIEAPHLFEGLLTTNDLVEPSGTHAFHWIGRWDNVINSGGVKIVPESVELKIRPLLNQRFIIGSKTEDRLGQQVVLVIEGPEFNTSELLAQITQKVDRFEVPRVVFFIDAFPETETGKIKRIEALNLID